MQSWLNKLLEVLTIMSPLNTMGQSESDSGWYLQEKGLFSDPSRIWGAVPSHPGQVEGIENSGRVSKQILILHEKTGFEKWYGTKL